MEYDYILERMTAQEFQELIQALMEAEYGLACDPFPVLGSDGGRDIVIRNNQNPNGNDEIWIQAKYKSGNTQRDTTWICSQVKRELQKITSYAQEGKTHLPYAWICYTNISISGVVQTGAHDRLQTIFSDFRDKIPKLEVFGKEKVSVLLRNHPNVAKSFSSTIYPEIWNHSESKRVIAIWPSTLAQYCHSIEAEEELKKLINRKKQPIFITGFGGIGKSEFATHVIPDVWKNHAYRVVFEKDLLHTIASIEIDGLKRTDARGRPKSPEILFQECMEVLRVELSEKDILVIDNYDIINPFEDPNFTKVCALKAHVVFVGRTAPIEYADRTVYIKPLPESDLLSIMKFFYHGACRDSELLDLIRLVERHTLTVELTARLLQASRGTLSPVQLLEKLRNSNLNLSPTHVRSDKDRGTPGHQTYDEVQGHLHALFVIAHLTLEQQCIMSAAGLLPVRGMQIPLFYDFLKLHDMTAMNQLLELGWLRVQSQQKQAIDRLERAEALLDSENIKIFRQQMVAQLYYELSTCKYQIRKEVPGYLEQAEDAAWKSLRYREAEYGKADAV